MVPCVWLNMRRRTMLEIPPHKASLIEGLHLTQRKDSKLLRPCRLGVKGKSVASARQGGLKGDYGKPKCLAGEA